MTFERIVRPFQTVPFTPVARRPVVEAEEPAEDVVLRIGDSGASIKTLSGSTSAQRTAFTVEETKEVGRDVTVRRVENPSDPSQYVDVEDTNSVELESGKKDTYRKQEITFKPANS